MSSPTILIVDDVPDIVEEMIHMLALLDLKAVGACSLGAAITRLTEYPDVRLLICDLRLHGENGTDICGRIDEHPALSARRFNIIFMSGDAERVENMISEPGRVILTKPVEPRILISTIVDCLEDGASGG